MAKKTVTKKKKKKTRKLKPQKILRVAAFTKACKDLIAAYKSNEYSPGNCPLCVIAKGIVDRKIREGKDAQHYCNYCLWTIFKPSDFKLDEAARSGCTGYWKESFIDRICRLQIWIKLMSNQLIINSRKCRKVRDKKKRLNYNG